MIEITGILPNIIANEYKSRNGDMDNIIVKGNDIDIQIYKNSSITTIVGLWLGNGTYELIQLNDDANIFPEYDEGDVISIDVIKKVLLSDLLKNNAIMSFNLLGRIKHGIQDKIDKHIQDYRQNESERKSYRNAKTKQRKDWWHDNLDKDSAQEYIRKQEGFSRAKVGNVELIDDNDGKTYKVLVGNPETQNYSVWQIYRNGNYFKTTNVEKDLSKQDCLDSYSKIKTLEESRNEYPYESEHPEEWDEQKYQEEYLQEQHSDNSPYEEDGSIQMSDDSEDAEVYDESMYTIEDEYGDIEDKDLALYAQSYHSNIISGKLKKKKSKYNGCNVTGCEDGNLTGGEGGLC